MCVKFDNFYFRISFAPRLNFVGLHIHTHQNWSNSDIFEIWEDGVGLSTARFDFVFNMVTLIINNFYL